MRLVSIIGDSLSTFEGYNPHGYEVYYDREMQALNQLESPYDTWWAKVNQALFALLCVNNSYSGSTVTGKTFPSGGSGERIQGLRTKEYIPDYILVYLGFNDFGRGIEVYPPDIRSHRGPESVFFSESYDNMIKSIKSYYPAAAVVCGTLMRTRIKDRADWPFPERYAGIELEEYNNAIRSIARQNHCYLADIASTGERYETLDGSHPTARGHATLAAGWIGCLGKMGLLTPSIEACINIYHQHMSAPSGEFLPVYADMVFEALTTEKVLLPFNEDGAFATMRYANEKAVPVFTSPNEPGNSGAVRLHAVFLKNYADTLLSAGHMLAINPYSEPDKQLILTADVVKEALIPILNSRNQRRMGP